MRDKLEIYDIGWQQRIQSFRMSHILLTVGFAFGLLIALSSCSPVYSMTWYKYYGDAERYAADTKQVNWDKVIELLNKAIAIEPQPEKAKIGGGDRLFDYYPYLRLGEAYLAKGKLEDAYRSCHKEESFGIAPEEEINRCLNSAIPKGGGVGFFQGLFRKNPERFKTWAIVIGIDEYSEKNGFKKLPYAVRDAKALEAYLIEDLKYPKERIWSLYNDEATKESIEELFQDVAQLPKTARVLVYFSGHGEACFKLTKSSFQNLRDSEMFPDKKGVPDTVLESLQNLQDIEICTQNRFIEAIKEQIGIWNADSYKEKILKYAMTEKNGFLIPIDGKGSELSSSCIPMHQINESLNQIPARQVIFILDACYSGIAGIIKKQGSEDLRKVPFAQTMLFFETRGRQIMTAGASNEAAQMDENSNGQWNGHSVYTFHLLQALKGGAEYNKDGFISALELQLYTSSKVSSETNGKQNPQLFSLDSTEGQFIFYKEGEL